MAHQARVLRPVLLVAQRDVHERVHEHAGSADAAEDAREVDRDALPVVAQGHLLGHLPRSWHCSLGRRGVQPVHALRSSRRAAHRFLAVRELPRHMQSESSGHRRPGAHHLVRALRTEEALVHVRALHEPPVATF